MMQEIKSKQEQATIIRSTLLIYNDAKLTMKFETKTNQAPLSQTERCNPSQPVFRQAKSSLLAAFNSQLSSAY